VHGTRRARAAFIVGMVAAGLGFVALAVLARDQPYFPVDLTITRTVQEAQAPWFELVLRPFNLLGFPPMVDVIYGAVTLIILLRGLRWAAASCAFAGLGTAALNFGAKALVDRPRPPVGLVHVEHHIANSTFPAGHVLNFTAFAGFLLYLVYVRQAPSWHRTTMITVLLIMIALMGVARVHAGEHWPSDVLAAYLLGGIWLAATIRFYRWRADRFRRGAAHEPKGEDPRLAPATPSGEHDFAHLTRDLEVLPRGDDERRYGGPVGADPPIP
jgi:undecaprenyl-diphosphatase